MRTTFLTRAAHRAARSVIWMGLLLLALPACRKYDGVSGYDRMLMRREAGAKALQDAGVKVTPSSIKQLGKLTYKVDLSGMQVTDELLESLKGLDGLIAELDLSRSTITDEQIDIINRVEIGALIAKLDLSHTGITDAGLDRLTKQLVLAELSVVGTKVTAAGVQRLKKRRAEQPQNLVKTTNVKM
jgi:hypothetical protein